jgi:hypothetical protein
MGKRVFFGGIALTAIAVAFLLTDHLCWEPGVTAANVRRIRPGMTVQDVKAILGGPDSATAWLGVEISTGLPEMPLVGSFISVDDFKLEPAGKDNLAPALSPASKPECRHWRGDQGTAKVEFDRKDRVMSARFEPFPQAGCLSRLRVWLGW